MKTKLNRAGRTLALIALAATTLASVGCLGLDMGLGPVGTPQTYFGQSGPSKWDAAGGYESTPTGPPAGYHFDMGTHWVKDGTNQMFNVLANHHPQCPACRAGR